MHHERVQHHLRRVVVQEVGGCYGVVWLVVWWCGGVDCMLGRGAARDQPATQAGQEPQQNHSAHFADPWIML